MGVLIKGHSFCAFLLLHGIFSPLLVHAQDIGSVNITVPYQHSASALERKLLSGYTAIARPSKNQSAPTLVKISPLDISLIEVHEEEQTIFVTGTLYLQWKDDYLNWDISVYGVDRVIFWPWDVWIPDLTLYNNAIGTMMGKLGAFDDKVSVKYDGTCDQQPTISMRATCSFDYTMYPYDVQECPLIMGSWSHTLKDMDVEPLPKDRLPPNKRVFSNKRQLSGGTAQNWQLIDTRVELTYWNAYVRERGKSKPPRNVSYLVFPEYTIWLTLKRVAPYFAWMVLVPAVMTSLFTLGSYWIRNALQAATLSLINVLLQLVFTDDVIRKVPPSNGQTPKIIRYIALNLTCTVLTTIFHVILYELNDFNRKRREIPTVLSLLVEKRQNLVIGLQKNQRFFQFSRQIDETDDDDVIVRGEDDVTNQQPAEADHSKKDLIEEKSINRKSSDWRMVVDALRCVLFLSFALIYFISALILLL